MKTRAEIWQADLDTTGSNAVSAATRILSGFQGDLNALRALSQSLKTCLPRVSDLLSAERRESVRLVGGRGGRRRASQRYRTPIYHSAPRRYSSTRRRLASWPEPIRPEPTNSSIAVCIDAVSAISKTRSRLRRARLRRPAPPEVEVANTPTPSCSPTDTSAVSRCSTAALRPIAPIC